MAAGRPTLGVERSILGRPWRDRLDEAGEARARAIAQRHGLPDLLARVIAARGAGLDDAPAFLAPTVRALMPDPSSLQGMDAAVDRLASAVVKGESVAIFGDYDVDGAASAALLAAVLAACGTPHRIHIPDRLIEGYGPNAAAIDALAATGATLLVAVDCGTTSHAALAHARARGFDTIVIDHHQAAATLPDAVVVNPNRGDDLSGLGHLCAAGVVFMVLVALLRMLRTTGFFTAAGAPDLLAMLDLVALATIADVVPLRGLNRAFVQTGLAVMRARARPGLAALLDLAGAGGPPQPYHLGFLVGPRINAGGRIGDASLGARLLGLDDPLEARAIAETLHRLNAERQAIEAVGLAEAEAQALVQSMGSPDASVVITAAEGWHPGVVGLIAARLAARYGRPAFAIALTDGVGTGSGRSISGVDLGAAVRAAVEADLLLRGGGHAMAAGLTVDAGKLSALRAFLDERLAADIAVARRGNALFVDAALAASAADPALVTAFDAAGPFGSGNPEPVFVLPGHRIAAVTPAGTEHLRIRLKAGDGAMLDAMAFRVAPPLAAALRDAQGGGRLHVAGTLGLDRWGGRERVQLRLLDLAPAP